MRKGDRGPQSKDAAGRIGERALMFLAQEPMRLQRFMAESGLAPDELRAGADDPDLLAAVLDHVTSDETLLLVFAAECDLHPDHVMRARHLLSGLTGGDDA